MSLALTATVSRAQVGGGNQAAGVALPGPTPPQVVDIGPNHRLWQWREYEPMPNGQAMARLHQYREIASGLNYLSATRSWLPSQEIIEVFAGGAIARQGQHQVIFANNLNTPGAIDMQTPDGKRLRSNVLGLMYSDPTTGQAVQIAQLQDSDGQLVADNQVLYTSAFEGVNADVLFIYRRDGMEQNVILREQLPAPEAYGMNSATTELGVFTEFISPPAASVADLVPNAPETDQAISWGATTLGRGKAFNLNGDDAPAMVFKRYSTVNGRYFLLEKVRLRDIQQGLARLPEQASNARRLPGMASKNPVIPKAATAKSAARPMRLALGLPADKGYVLDYNTLNVSYTNYTFQADMTYFISGNVNLYGTTFFEGGTVIKFSTNCSITLVSGSSAKFQTALYRPVIFTAKDENGFGEGISGSTGNPSGYYANPALNIGSLTNVTLSEFRICYANRGLSVSGSSPALYNAQFVNCAIAVSDINGVVTNENVLFSNIKTNFNTTGSTNTIFVQNATFNNNFDLVNGSPANTRLCLTNCVFVNVTNESGSITAGYIGFYKSTPVGSPTVTTTNYPLQVAGAASCYLADGCAFVCAGTPNVDQTNLVQLSLRTTHPPVIYSNITLSGTATLSPQAQRDATNSPDLGYHYDPLDYVFGQVRVSTNMTFTTGTAVGWFETPGSGGPGYGVGLNNGIRANFNGIATVPCYFARYSMVQEGCNGLWKNKGYLGGIANADSYNPANPANLTMTFTRWSHPPADPNHFRDGSGGQPLAVQATHCEILGQFGGYNLEFAFTNCLFERAYIAHQSGVSYSFEIYRDCTFRGGSLNFSHSESGAPYWYSQLRDCAFDGTTFSINTPFGTNTTYADYNYNAFLQGAAQPPTEGTNTITVTNFNWQSSWLGNYYVPTSSPLINAGDTTADKLGLYHFTTQTNQVKETNSIVDMCYHYVAVDTNGIPFDTNGDGLPDYLSDSNGNGLVDSGEIGWNIVGDLGLKVLISQPRNGSFTP